MFRIELTPPRSPTDGNGRADRYTPPEPHVRNVLSTYRCLECLDHTISREFDTSHLSVTCPVCDSFERFVNETVFEQFRSFEESPPESLDWAAIEREEKLLISEQIARKNRSIEEFSIEA
jgi:hypothetical protein